jgi:hypothetical protein
MNNNWVMTLKEAVVFLIMVLVSSFMRGLWKDGRKSDHSKGEFAKLRSLIIFFFISVFPHGKPRKPLDELSCNIIFELFSKVFRENSSSLKI